MKEFRTLCADEIEIRIGRVRTSGISLLLYKNARADMNILDETVGAENWQRSHSRDNANCIVSIWDDQKQQWIAKEDTGVESNTEADKGKASDSFKRACVNWGIGRELYTAPFIWIPAHFCHIEATQRKDRNGNSVLVCRDEFGVNKIEYDSQKRIVALRIINQKTVAVVFSQKKNDYGGWNEWHGEVEQQARKPIQQPIQQTHQPIQQETRKVQRQQAVNQSNIIRVPTNTRTSERTTTLTSPTPTSPAPADAKPRGNMQRRQQQIRAGEQYSFYGFDEESWASLM